MSKLYLQSDPDWLHARADELTIRCPGSLFGNIYIRTGLHSCGGIKDGVAVRQAGQYTGYVMSFEDMEAAYFQARELRQTRGLPVREVDHG